MNDDDKELLDELIGPGDLEGLGEGPSVVTFPCPGDPMTGFLSAARQSGMVEATCHSCGRPWLTRPKRTEEQHRVGTGQASLLFLQRWEAPKLCPLCNPDHIAYEPGGPADRARWFEAWRSQLLGVMEQRAAPRLLLVERSVWVDDIPLQLYECRPRIGGEILWWHSARYGRLPHIFQRGHRWTFAGGAYLTGWFPAGDAIQALMEPAVQDAPDRRVQYVVPFSPRPVLR